jgi:hypothetical protein
MMDRIFQGGTADWFMGTSWRPDGTPVPGDIMTIASGEGTISAADVQTFGTLDTEQLLIGSNSAATPASFSADGAAFGSGFTIDSTGDGYADLNFSGSTTYAGTIDLATAGGMAAINIAADDTGVGNLQLQGSVAVENGDDLTVNGGTLDMAGTITVSDSDLTIGSNTTLAGDGVINIGAHGTVVLNGRIDAGITINFLDGTGTLDIVDPLDFHASVAGFVTGDKLDLIDAPSDYWSYGTTGTISPPSTKLTVYSGNSTSSPDPEVAKFALTSTTALTTQQIYVGSDDDGGSLVLLSTTRDWIGGHGDWYGAGNWSTVGTLTANSYPLFGDTAIIRAGAATITAADFAKFGTLDDELIRLQGKDTRLVVTDGTLGPDLKLYSEASQADTTLVANGTVTSDGLIRVSGDNSTFHIAIGSDGAAAGDLVIGQFGTVNVSSESALDIASGQITNDGQITVSGPMTVEAGATIDGDGVIALDSSQITLTVAGTIGAEQQISMFHNTLRIAQGAAFDGIIEGFDNSDTIDLEGAVANYASYDSETGVLTLRDGGATGTVVDSFNVAGNFGPNDFSATSDGNGGTFITDTAFAATRTFQSTLPAPAVADTGNSVSLVQLLVESFGTSALSFPDVGLYSDSPADMAYFSYWDPNNPLLSSWTLNGTTLSPDNLETIPQSEFADVDYVSGNAIQANATIQIPVAFDSNGVAKDYVDYSVQNFGTGFAQASLTTGAPTPQDVVNAASAFAAAYTDVPNTEDCYNIAHEVAAAAGATMTQNTGSTNPAQNVAGGFWRIAYAAPAGNSAVANWSTLVQAGDILRIGWANSQGPHSFTILAPLDAAGRIAVFDNVYDATGYEAIGIHYVQYWTLTDPNDITIFRLDPKDLYLVDTTTDDGKLVQNMPHALVLGTTFNDLIIPSGTGDTITGGGGNDVIAGTSAILDGTKITDFQSGDTIDVTDLNSAVTSAQYDPRTGVLDIISNNEVVDDLYLAKDLLGTFTVSNDGGTAGLDVGTLGTLYNSLFTGSTPDGSLIALVTCFAAGTRIATPAGETPVQDLAIGDTVLCIGGRSQTITWIGRRSLDVTRHPQPERVLPVRIAAGAFGVGLPRRPLLLSPDHAVFAEGVLIPVRHLINGNTIAQLLASHISHLTYFHIELPEHDVVLAEQLPVESYLETGNRASFSNSGQEVVLFPDFAPLIWDARGYAALRIIGPEVDAVRARLQQHVPHKDVVSSTH